MENFEELAEQFAPMIHHIIQTLHIYKNKEEYYQIGLIGLWKAMKSFDAEKSHFSSFAYLNIKGQIMNELKRKHKLEEKVMIPKEGYWETVEDGAFQHPLELELLLSYCEKLTEKEKKWVMANCLDGYSVREIAERENVSVSAVKQWRSNAKKKVLLQWKRMER